MRTLTLLRHGKASPHGSSIKDTERPLTLRGSQDVEEVAARLRSHAPPIDLVLGSSARRVVETIDQFEKTYGAIGSRETVEEMYDATCETLLHIVRRTEDRVQHLLLVGHNPGLKDLAAMLARPPLLPGVADGFQTAAFAVLNFPAAVSRDVQPAAGALVDFWAPMRRRGAEIP